MSTRVHRLGVCLLAVVVGLAGLALAAPAPSRPAADTVKDRKTFIPQRKYEPMPGKVIGVLVSNVQAMMNQEGRSGPPDAMGFSSNGNSYRWTYVPVAEKPLIRNLQVKLGEKGDQMKIYPSLSMASAATVKQWDIDVPYALVEVEVNDGMGAPADEGFVATSMKQLDGTKEYPLKLAGVIADVRKRQERYLKDDKKAIDEALAKSQEEALKDRKPTGPRATEEVMYVTWLPRTQHLSVRFRTRISDGAYQYIEGPARPRPVPLPLPPNRKPGGALAAPPAPAAVRPPPPPRFRIRTGTTFGIEFGRAYELDKSGKVVKISTLPFESFHQELPPPPARFLPPGGALPPGKALLPEKKKD